MIIYLKGVINIDLLIFNIIIFIIIYYIIIILFIYIIISNTINTTNKAK